MSGIPSLTQRVDLLDSRSRRFLQYLLVGVVGIGINEGLLYFITGVVGLSYVVGGTLGRAVSILTNYAMNDRWTWRNYGERGRRQWAWRGLKYGATRLVGVALGVGVLVVLVEVGGLHYLVANLIAIGVGVLWGFGASDRWVWNTTGDSSSYLLGYWTRVRHAFEVVDRPTWYVIGLSAALFVGFSVYTSLLFAGYKLTGADFGSYVHMFSTTVNGDGFLQQGKFRASHPGGSYWGAHFSLTLLVFLVPFALVPSPLTLLVVKAFVLAASIPALWVVARSHLSDRVAGLVIVSYAFNPFLWSAWAFDFQEQILIPILVFGAYYAYTRRRYGAFLGLFALVLLTNEFVIMVAAGALLGLVVAAWSERRLGEEVHVFAVAFLSVVAIHVLAGRVIDHFSEYTGIPVWIVAGPLTPFFDAPRVGLVQLLPGVVTRPELFLTLLTTNGTEKFVFFVAFLLPVLFLALRDEISVGALVPFLGFAWVLGGKPAYYGFAAHYPLYLLPFLYIGAVRTLQSVTLPTISREAAARLVVYLLLLNAGSVYLIDGGNLKNIPGETDHTTLELALAGIPEDASLLTQNNIYPHVATRPEASFVVAAHQIRRYEALHGQITPEYIVYDTTLGHWWKQIPAAFGDRLGDEYGLYQLEDGVHVYKRGYTGFPTRITDDGYAELRYDATRLMTANSRVTGGSIVGEGGPEGRNIWFGPYTNLPAGTYTVTYRVDVENTGDANGAVALLNVAINHDTETVATEYATTTDGWEDITLTFTLAEPAKDVEFRARQAGESGTVKLDHVTLRVAETGDAPGNWDDSTSESRPVDAEGVRSVAVAGAVSDAHASGQWVLPTTVGSTGWWSP